MMMREILFRGKSENKDVGWVEGSLLITTYEPEDDAPFACYTIENTTHGIGSNSFMSGTSEVVDPETVGQYTGLNKNGKRIFEGDVLKCTDRYRHYVLYTVAFKDGSFMLKQNGVDYYVHFDGFPPKFYQFEVIGNIHDNPELVERESNE